MIKFIRPWICFYNLLARGISNATNRENQDKRYTLLV